MILGQDPALYYTPLRTHASMQALYPCVVTPTISVNKATVLLTEDGSIARLSSTYVHNFSSIFHNCGRPFAMAPYNPANMKCCT